MSKAILISIKPKYVADILNGKKTIEIRKTLPKCDLPIDVYIYCTAEDKNGYLIRNRSTKKCEFTYNGFVKSVCWSANRKVVAKFTLGNWEKWEIHPEKEPDEEDKEILKLSCLSVSETTKYAAGKPIYGWYIDNLVIFDKPKELNDFLIYSHTVNGIGFKCEEKQFNILKPLTRAPQSWCFVEI